jgi:HEAT repeat protein
VLLSRSDPQVRAAAADGLAELRDRSVAPVLAALLEEDLPKNVWAAVSAAHDRVK